VTTLILVRHGETTWNAEQRYQGQQDSQLSETGRLQARLTAERLTDCDAAALYSSDLRRAADFAAVIADRLGLAVESTPVLRERYGGLWEGLTWPEIVERFAEEAARSRSDPQFSPPGAETREQLRERAVSFVGRALDRHRDQTVIAVTHGGFINSALRHLLGAGLLPGGRMRPANGGITVITHNGEGWRLDAFNDTCHLTQPADQRETAAELRLLEHE
jgi:broad specificity phosphatase PhoE